MAGVGTVMLKLSDIPMPMIFCPAIIKMYGSLRISKRNVLFMLRILRYLRVDFLNSPISCG